MQGHYEMIDVNGAPFSIEVPVFLSQYQPSSIKTMSTYHYDVHGCYDELIALLEQVSLTLRLIRCGSRATWSRGPGSLEVLRFVKQLAIAFASSLAMHDLHLLAVFTGISRNKPKDPAEIATRGTGCRRSAQLAASSANDVNR